MAYLPAGGALCSTSGVRRGLNGSMLVLDPRIFYNKPRGTVITAFEVS